MYSRPAQIFFLMSSKKKKSLCALEFFSSMTLEWKNDQVILFGLSYHNKSKKKKMLKSSTLLLTTKKKKEIILPLEVCVRT